MNIRLKSCIFRLIKLFGMERLMYSNSSYSQEGEDMILRRYLDVGSPGVYVDVGAHHPFRFSNTYFFYKNGWSGINIDPLPEVMNLFKATRPRDINLNVGVSKKSGTMSYYMFNEPALNTFDQTLAESRVSDVYKLIDTQEVRVAPLSTLLQQHGHAYDSIDFMSVDVEGHDLEVLKSNDWQKIRPKIVLVECLMPSSIDDLRADAVFNFMTGNGYKLVAKSLYSCFFKDGAL